MQLFCSCNKNQSNENISQDTEQANFVISTAYEYSYISKEGEITGMYTIDEENVIKYYSLDKLELCGNKRFDNGLYYNSQGSPMFYTLQETNNGIKRRDIIFNGGAIFKVINDGINVGLLKSSDHIEQLESSYDNKEIIVGWFDYRLVIDAHIYFLYEGNLMRTTINGNEETVLDIASCKKINTKGEYLYYIHRDLGTKEYMLYRIKLDGTVKEKVSNQVCFDYFLAPNGIIYLYENNNIIYIIYEEFAQKGVTVELGEFEKELHYYYQLTGEIEDVLYLSVINAPSIDDAGKVEIYSYTNGGLELIH